MKMTPRELEIFEQEIATRVDRGIELLQKHHQYSPYNWYRRIHANHISMFRLDKSPLAQVYGKFEEGCGQLSLVPYERRCAEAGFLPYLMVTGSYPGEASVELKLEREALEKVWCEKILSLQQNNAYLQIGDRFRFVQNQKHFTNTMTITDLQSGRTATYPVQQDDFVKTMFRTLFEPKEEPVPGSTLDLAKNIKWAGFLWTIEGTYQGEDGQTWVRIRTLVGPENTTHVSLNELQQTAVSC